MCRRPSRNPLFSGRDDELDALSEMVTDGPAAIIAEPGLARAGRTELALEYTHRFALRYDVIWWFPAGADLAAECARIGQEVARAGLRPVPSRGWLFVFEGRSRFADFNEHLPSSEAHVILVPKDAGDAGDAGDRDGQNTGKIVLGALKENESLLLLSQVAPLINPQQAKEIAALLAHRPAPLTEVGRIIADGPMDPHICARLLRLGAESGGPAVPVPAVADLVPKPRVSDGEPQRVEDDLAQTLDKLPILDDPQAQTQLSERIFGRRTMPWQTNPYPAVRRRGLIMACKDQRRLRKAGEALRELAQDPAADNAKILFERLADLIGE
ncbi:hypothetical protein DPM19_13630 [Actinomadura craniellae]|uniref:Tetratricopeptide repeat protein n=1 Tax=Actinomadura craniellae TaxID=2231787 RepID=A0A365H6N8_9ACTN|nr:hypothetical protein [Actinomadura craniellae]RAY14775.1 hypothetical protein DPM19_13630 [Actinomadura craniellae]